MLRDMDLVKDILIELGNNTPGTSYNSENFEIPGHDPEEVHFHLYLLEQAGLIEAHDATGMGSQGPEMIPLWLTWNGYEFLEAASNEGIWEKAKGVLKEQGLGTSFDLMKTLLVKLGQEAISG